MLIELILMMT